jgi:glycine cleavage system H protein
VYSPLGGTVLAGNESLATQPELINQDPYGQGWILRLKPTDAGGSAELQDASAYAAEVAGD